MDLQQVARIIGIGSGGVLALLLVLSFVGALYQTLGIVGDARKYPPPGKRVDVGGYRLHVSSSGEGSPTVVMDSGMCHVSPIWGLVQPEVARFTRACSYDRAGYAWSDPGPGPRTSQQIARELHTLLITAAIPGPYVLVGHSFGGLNMCTYAGMYPDEVAGMVLVDALSTHIAMHNSTEFQYFLAASRRKFRFLSIMNRLGLVRLFLWLRGVDAALDFVRKLPSEIAPLVPAGSLRKTLDAAAAECAWMAESIGSAALTDRLHLPIDLPLVVLSHGIPDMFTGNLSSGEAEQAEQIWQQVQAALVGLSSQGKLLIAAKSGHKIHIDQPELVVDAIRQVVEAVRKNLKGGASR